MCTGHEARVHGGSVCTVHARVHGTIPCARGSQESLHKFLMKGGSWMSHSTLTSSLNGNHTHFLRHVVQESLLYGKVYMESICIERLSKS